MPSASIAASLASMCCSRSIVAAASSSPRTKSDIR
jgi:hypothetical protein